MTEKPEQMLPQQDVTTFRRVEEMGSDQAIENQAGTRDHNGWHRHDDNE